MCIPQLTCPLAMYKVNAMGWGERRHTPCSMVMAVEDASTAKPKCQVTPKGVPTPNIRGLHSHKMHGRNRGVTKEMVGANRYKGR